MTPIMHPDTFIEVILKAKKLKLKNLQEEHMIAIAVFNAKLEMLMSDVDTLEKRIADSKK